MPRDAPLNALPPRHYWLHYLARRGVMLRVRCQRLSYAAAPFSRRVTATPIDDAATLLR